ncbi:hypothetical protein CRM22_005061, partial [Opisthorchis felineus]
STSSVLTGRVTNTRDSAFIPCPAGLITLWQRTRATYIPQHFHYHFVYSLKIPEGQLAVRTSYI